MIAKIKKIYSSASVEMKSTFWFMFCSIFPQLINVFSSMIFTRILTTEDYGITSNYSAWYSVVSIFFTLNLNCGVYNNAMLKYDNKRDDYDAGMMGLSLTLGAIGLLSMLFFSTFWLNVTELPMALILCLGIQCLAYNPYGCMLARTKYEYNYKRLIKITIITSVLSPILSILGIITFGNKAVGKIWGQYIIIILIGIVIYLNVLRKKKKLFVAEYWRYALKFNIPLIPHYLSLVILNQSDRIMIVKMCGSSDNGLYSVAYSAASLLLVFTSGITQALTPWIYNQCKNNRNSLIKDKIKVAYIGFGVLISAVIIIAPEIIYILAGSKYKESTNIFPLLATSMFFVFIYNILSILEFYHEKTAPVMMCSSISAVLNIILNYIFIDEFGYQAAAYTTLACYIINSLMHYAVIRKIYNKYYKEKTDFMCTKISFITGIIIIGYSFICIKLYSTPVVRWFVFTAVCMIMLLNKNKIIRKIKN